MSNILSAYAIDPNANRIALNFYREILAESGSWKDIGLLVVVPGYETTLPMAQSLASDENLREIIMKNSTGLRNPKVAKALRAAKYPIIDITKADMKLAGNEAVTKIYEAVAPYEKFVVMDHGGYFALSPEIFQQFPPAALIGISEYTINGQQRYISQGLLDRPIMSVAALELKRETDKAIANSIVLVSDFQLRRGGIMLSDKRNCIGVIGYGNVGSHLVQRLLDLDAQNILVYDIVAQKLANLPARLVAISNDEICQRCNVIYCAAAGGQALAPRDYAELRENAVIFSVTSPDDEFGLDGLVENGILKHVLAKKDQDNYVYQVVSTGREITFPFNGNAPNTILEYGTADPIIHQASAAHIMAAKRLAQNHNNYQRGLHSPEAIDQETVLRVWQKHYPMPVR